MRARGFSYEDGMQDFDFDQDTYLLKDGHAVSSSGKDFNTKPVPGNVLLNVYATIDNGTLLFPETHPFYNFGLIYNDSDLQDTWDETVSEDIMGYFYHAVIDIYEIQATLRS